MNITQYDSFTNRGTLYNYGTMTNSSSSGSAFINQGVIWSNSDISSVFTGSDIFKTLVIFDGVQDDAIAVMTQADADALIAWQRWRPQQSRRQIVDQTTTRLGNISL